MAAKVGYLIAHVRYVVSVWSDLLESEHGYGKAGKGVTSFCRSFQADRERPDRKRQRTWRTSWAPGADQRAPGRFMRSWTTCLAALSMAPEPMGKPRARKSG